MGWGPEGLALSIHAASPRELPLEMAPTEPNCRYQNQSGRVEALCREAWICGTRALLNPIRRPEIAGVAPSWPVELSDSTA